VSSYYGPDADLMARLDLASHVLPSAMPESTFEEQIARRDRMVSVTSFAELSAEDQDWLNQACVAVTGGHTASLQHPDGRGGDWAAEDAALEAGLPVPIVAAGASGAVGVEFAGDVPVSELVVEGKGFDFVEPADDEWVGVA
jgi:hypothetical protein